MPKTSKTTVHQGQNGQYKVTIPKALGDAMNLDGADVEWEVAAGKKLELEKIDD